MEKVPEDKQQKPHCLILPYPIQGHINPMLQFSKRLLHKGVAITLVVTNHLAATTLFSSSAAAAGVTLETISDGWDHARPAGLSADLYLESFQRVGSRTLKEAVRRLAGSGRAVDCVVYDPFVPWGLEVAKDLGLFAAAFFTQSCAVDHIYHRVYAGELELPLPEEEEVVAIPGLPPLRPEDMPSFVFAYGSYPPVFEMVVNQFRGIERADWLFYNTFYKLEAEVIDYMAKTTPVKAIGPAIPSMYLDKRLPDDREYGLSLYKPDAGVCMDWLSKQRPESVVYVSFGSLAELNEKQMEELARGLKLSDKNFLWVVRSNEHSKLPKDFAAESSEKGIIVPWCPQLDVLSHEAVCCFLTHCGWNSTLEALCLGVPMVGVPQWSDQSTNAKFVMDVWETGVRARADGNGVVGGETIADCIREVAEGGRSTEIKKNVSKWKDLAKEAMAEGGDSELNIEEFVSFLVANALPRKVGEMNLL